MRNVFAKKADPTKLGIALQGGGSYGAYTKGVLKALFNSEVFNKPSMEVKAVTGTSAGAVNGALITYGLNKGGPADAVKILDSFWKDISDIGAQNKVFMSLNPFGAQYPNLPRNVLSMMRMLPSGYVPGQLKDLMENHIVDWQAVQNGSVKLFVNAVEETKDGKRKHVVFKGKNLSADAVAASGGLQELGGHKIGDRQFYDGAYWRNPCMSDIKKEEITDLLVITIQRKPDGDVEPIHQDDARKKHKKPGHEVLTEEIHNHIAHIHKHHPKLNLHVISLDVQPHWNETSRMNNDPKWLAELEDMGFKDGQKWLEDNAKNLGKKSSYTLPAAPPAP